MSTLASRAVEALAPAAGSKPLPSLVMRLVEAREEQATRRVHSYLQRLGFSVDDIAALRAGELRFPPGGS